MFTSVPRSLRLILQFCPTRIRRRFVPGMSLPANSSKRTRSKRTGALHFRTVALFSSRGVALGRMIASATDRLDANGSEILPVTVRPLVLLLALLFKYNDLAFSAMLDHGARHRRPINERRPNLDAIPVASRHHVEMNC